LVYVELGPVPPNCVAVKIPEEVVQVYELPEEWPFKQ